MLLAGSDASLEMDAYKHFLDPAPAAARAAEQAAALNKKMRRLSREAQAQRELAESGAALPSLVDRSIFALM